MLLTHPVYPPSVPAVCHHTLALSLRAAPVTCFSTNGNIVLSGCQDGVLKMWRLSDGQLADMCSMPTGTSITALSTVGPLLVGGSGWWKQGKLCPHATFSRQRSSASSPSCVHTQHARHTRTHLLHLPLCASNACMPCCRCMQVAAGTSSSSITLYDIASGRLLAVQRLMAGPGAVQSLAPWVPSQQLAAANLAAGGPLPPDGGGVLPRLTAADTQEGKWGGASSWHEMSCLVLRCVHSIQFLVKALSGAHTACHQM